MLTQELICHEVVVCGNRTLKKEWSLTWMYLDTDLNMVLLTGNVRAILTIPLPQPATYSLHSWAGGYFLLAAAVVNTSLELEDMTTSFTIIVSQLRVSYDHHISSQTYLWKQSFVACKVESWWKHCSSGHMYLHVQIFSSLQWPVTLWGWWHPNILSHESKYGHHYVIIT